MRASNKKAAAPTKETSGLSKSRSTKSIPARFLTPRQRRAARALLQADRTLQQIMRIAPANNAAMMVKTLRDRFGLTIPCARVPFVTIDGKRSFFGRYSLTRDDRTKLRCILGTA